MDFCFQNKVQAPQQGLQGPSHGGLLSSSAVAHSLWTQDLGSKSPWSRGCKCLEPVSMPFTLPGLLFLSPPPSQSDFHFSRAPHPEDSREILLVHTLILDKNAKGQGLHVEGKSRDSSLSSLTSKHCSACARKFLSQGTAVGRWSMLFRFFFSFLKKTFILSIFDEGNFKDLFSMICTYGALPSIYHARGIITFKS